MKKFIFLLCLIPLVGFSQEFGNYKVEDATIYNNETKFISNKWYKDKEGKFCLKIYNQTPIGIKNAISDIRSILFANDLKWEISFVDNSFLSSLVSSIDDYEILNITIKDESSEVNKQWKIAEFTFVSLNLKKDKYEINLIKL